MTNMKRSTEITTLFVDIGGVLLTDGWDHHARRRAAKHFKLDWAEMEDRHDLNFETHEEDKLTLEEYLDRVVFYEKRPFTRAQFRRFMFAQSKPYAEMIELVRQPESQIRIEDYRRQQRIARIECLSDSASSSWTGLWMLLFPPASFISANRTRTFSAGAGHRPDTSPADSLYRKHPDVRPDRGRFGDSKHSSHGLQIHLRETGFVRIAE